MVRLPAVYGSTLRDVSDGCNFHIRVMESCIRVFETHDCIASVLVLQAWTMCVLIYLFVCVFVHMCLTVGLLKVL